MIELEEISKDDVKPGDEIIWKWEGGQLEGSTHFVHYTMPIVDGSRKLQADWDLVMSWNRTFYRVKR